MESSQVEEGSSSESGWTMYIVSPTHESEEEEEDDSVVKLRRFSGCRRNRDKKEEKEAYNSDDSMVSDASSGPRYRGVESRVWREEEKVGRKREGRRKGWAVEEEKGRAPPVSAASRARR